MRLEKISLLLNFAQKKNWIILTKFACHRILKSSKKISFETIVYHFHHFLFHFEPIFIFYVTPKQASKNCMEPLLKIMDLGVFPTNSLWPPKERLTLKKIIWIYYLPFSSECFLPQSPPAASLPHILQYKPTELISGDIAWVVFIWLRNTEDVKDIQIWTLYIHHISISSFKGKMAIIMF